MRRVATMAAAFIVGALGAAHATTPMVACSTLTDDAARLACYDAVARQGSATDGVGATSGWALRTDVDTMFDAKSHLILARAASGDVGYLALRCAEAGRHSIYVEFGFGSLLKGRTSESSPILAYRINSEPAQFTASEVKEDRLFLRDIFARSFVQALARAGRLLVRAADSRGRYLNRQFDLEGTAEAIGKIRVLCDDPE